jgi:DinB family protein
VKGTIDMSNLRACALAERLEEGSNNLADFAGKLSQAEWHTTLPGDGRTVGVVVHHVASVYPLEVQLALRVGDGKPITGVTMKDVHEMNAKHARENERVAPEAALQLLRRNSAVAAAAIRSLSDEQLARAASVSLYADAPVTCQFVLEDHAVRHSYHHLAGIRRALKR